MRKCAGNLFFIYIKKLLKKVIYHHINYKNNRLLCKLTIKEGNIYTMK